MGRKKGAIPWNKGITYNKEYKDKLSKAHTGVKLSEEHRKKISSGHKGLVFSDEHREKLRIRALNRKHTEESKEKMSIANKGENCRFWQGGKSFEVYSLDWTRTLRISIRERDKYTCKICGESQGDITHHIHHIDYNKNNCNPSNLITLCRSCHMKTNGNREYWINYFNSTP